MAIPGIHIVLNKDKGEQIEDLLERAWPINFDEIPRVWFLCDKPEQGGPYRETKLKSKSSNPGNVNIGQMEADLMFATLRRVWDRIIIPFPKSKH